MKKLLFILLFCIAGFSLSYAQEEQMNFHKLKGMEDSTGVTHLFYRIYHTVSASCTDMDGYTSTISNVKNHIYHYNTSNLEDSVEFKSNNSFSPGCYEEWNKTERIIFTDTHPDSTFQIKSTLGGLYGWYYIPISSEHQFGLNIGNPLGIGFDKEFNDLVISTPFRNLVIKAKFYNEDLLGKSFRYSQEDNSIWFEYNDISDLPDSLFIDFTVTGVSHYKNGHYVGIKDSAIVLSNDYGQTFEQIVQHSWEEWELNDARFGNTYFDADSNSFYISFNYSSGFRPSNGEEVFLVKKGPDKWSFKELSAYQSFRFALDVQNSGSFYFSTNDSLLYSGDFGETHSFIKIFQSEITGLYKKPDSDILYILTREELLEVNTETGESTTLKQLPVSNEPEPGEIPNKITLHQNYPNPFNPSTRIQYILPEDSYVELHIFDSVGRRLQTLVDEYKQAGPHVVTFDASGYSSGVYYYQLSAPDIPAKFLKKMTLIK